MTRNPRSFALAVAVFVNLAALVTVHTAMGEVVQREQAAQFAADRIVITTHRAGAYQFAARSCATPSTL